jgi:hypothetical protein
VVWSDEFLGCSTEPFSGTAAISYFIILAAGMPANTIQLNKLRCLDINENEHRMRVSLCK